jgi:hypothetical protein
VKPAHPANVTNPSGAGTEVGVVAVAAMVVATVTGAVTVVIGTEAEAGKVVPPGVVAAVVAGAATKPFRKK